MKKIISIVLIIVMCFVVMGCGDPKTIDNITYETIGIFEEKNPNIHYRVIIGNVVLAILLIETVIFPIYFVGFSLWEPVCLKDDYVIGQKYD
jgi:hypothetical protein